MPPNNHSRHRFCDGYYDAEGRAFLDSRVPYRYRELPDNRLHVVETGDTLFHLAGRYFSPMARAAGFWWVIADFQPDPIVDPTVKLVVGRTLVVPSVRTLLEEILNDARVGEPDEETT